MFNHKLIKIFLGFIFPLVIASCGSSNGSDTPSAIYVYVANYDGNSISQYKISDDGSLAPLSPSTVVTDGGPYSITIDPLNK